MSEAQPNAQTPNNPPSESPGPLRIPTPPDLVTRKALQRLSGHTTSPLWLPEGLWPELDELRADQLRLRRQVATCLDDLKALAAKFTHEDNQHAEALREAHRRGSPTSGKDPRTPADQRDAQRTAIEKRLWAGVQVFAEHADRVLAAVREHESDWLADLRSQMAPVQEKRHRAQGLLSEARAEEHQLHMLGRWVQSTADDQGFGRQPAPEVEPVPERVSAEVFADALERPWHKARPWNAGKTGTAA